MTTFAEALRIVTAKYRESDPGAGDCPIADYIETQIGWHDHTRCPETMAMQWMGRRS